MDTSSESTFSLNPFDHISFEIVFPKPHLLVSLTSSLENSLEIPLENPSLANIFSHSKKCFSNTLFTGEFTAIILIGKLTKSSYHDEIIQNLQRFRFFPSVFKRIFLENEEERLEEVPINSKLLDSQSLIENYEKKTIKNQFPNQYFYSAEHEKVIFFVNFPVLLSYHLTNSHLILEVLVEFNSEDQMKKSLLLRNPKDFQTFLQRKNSENLVKSENLLRKNSWKANEFKDELIERNMVGQFTPIHRKNLKKQFFLANPFEINSTTITFEEKILINIVISNSSNENFSNDNTISFIEEEAFCNEELEKIVDFDTTIIIKEFDFLLSWSTVRPLFLKDKEIKETFFPGLEERLLIEKYPESFNNEICFGNSFSFAILIKKNQNKEILAQPIKFPCKFCENNKESLSFSKTKLKKAKIFVRSKSKKKTFSNQRREISPKNLRESNVFERIYKTLSTKFDLKLQNEELFIKENSCKCTEVVNDQLNLKLKTPIVLKWARKNSWKESTCYRNLAWEIKTASVLEVKVKIEKQNYRIREEIVLELSVVNKSCEEMNLLCVLLEEFSDSQPELLQRKYRSESHLIEEKKISEFERKFSNLKHCQIVALSMERVVSLGRLKENEKKFCKVRLLPIQKGFFYIDYFIFYDFVKRIYIKSEIGLYFIIE